MQLSVSLISPTTVSRDHTENQTNMKSAIPQEGFDKSGGLIKSVTSTGCEDVFMSNKVSGTFEDGCYYLFELSFYSCSSSFSFKK